MASTERLKRLFDLAGAAGGLLAMNPVGSRPLPASEVTRLGSTAPRSGRLSLGLDRRYAADRSLSLDARLVAISFAVNALGKKRVRELLCRSRRTRRP
jgi:hypothetical protein